jgi:branched-chain amino acid transport system substrate-binding protein
MFQMNWRNVCILVAIFSLLFAAPALCEDKVFKLGVLGPFTGPSAKTGAEFKGSTEMALEKIGNKIGDYKIEVVWIDSQSDPAKAASAYGEACERSGIQAGVLNWHSSVAVALMDVAAQYKVPHLFGFGATEVVNEKWQKDPKKYNYWGVKGWPVPGKLMAGYVECIENAVKSGKFKPEAKKVAIYGEDSDWGRSAGGALKKNFEAAGWEVISEDYFPLTQTDFYPLLSKYKKAGAVVLAGTSTSPPSISAFVKQSAEVGLKAIIVADGLGWIGDWYKLTGPGSDYVLDMIPQLTTKESQAWAEDVKKKYGYKPSPSSGGLSYDGVNFMIKLLHRTLEKEGKLDKESVHKVMIEEVNTGKLTFSKADGALIMNEYKYTADTMPDPVLGRDAYFFPVIQYKGGKGAIVYPDDWATKEFEAK